MTTHELVERGEEIYQLRLRTELEKTHMNFFVAIEPTSGDYFLGSTLSEAAAAARAVYPDRRAYVARVGHRTAIQFGAGM